jgi:erythromycin esterase-like protein
VADSRADQYRAKRFLIEFSIGTASQEVESMDALETVRSSLKPLKEGFEELVHACSSSNYVLVGEASHGTHEFYEIRARLTRELIAHHGFHAVVVEADWPDANRIDRYMRGRSSDKAARDALAEFVRFPRWMWRNHVVSDFADWLRSHNAGRPNGAPEVGFYGMDLYSLHSSRSAVIKYLEQVDPDAARRARDRYGCFDHYGEDEQAYGMGTAYGVSESCEQAVVQQLVELQRRSWDYANRDGLLAQDEFFSAEQNARLVRNAEEYYRLMFKGRASTWNIRDQHMADTVHALSAHIERRYGSAKLVLWAHNSHLGDARYTDMARRREHNVGQLIRERYPNQTFIVGFTTYTGTVTAATNWDDDADTKRVRPGLPNSWETLFHEAGHPDFVLDLRGLRASKSLNTDRLERAIGVIYRPETERVSHYFNARLLEQFDAVIHVDTTRALEPLDRESMCTTEDMPETFPSGI